jgi:hypothetical protein
MRALAFAAVVVAAAIARPAHARKVASVAAGGVRYQVLCESCGKAMECLSVQAVGKGAPASKLALEDDTMCRGNDNVDIEFSARAFKLSPTLTGALIKEEAGGEAIAHTYWLVAIVDGTISKLWSAMYDSHEVVSIDSYTLKTVDTDGNGRQEIDYRAPFPVSNDSSFIQASMRANSGASDTWDHQLLEYSDDKKAMVEKSPHQEFAAVLSSNKNLNDALKQKLDLLKDPKCGAKDFLVLASEDLPKLFSGYYVVAAIAESRADAQAKLDRIKACRPKISGAIRQVR